MTSKIQLFYAPISPYVRKVMICAHELGLADEIELLPCAANPVRRDERIAEFNPLAKIPSARLPDGTFLFDSRVVCEYLNDRAKGGLFPAGPVRWRVLTLQALGDGLLDAALLVRYEGIWRAPEQRCPEWLAGQVTKISAALDWMEGTPGDYAAGFTIGSITIACALGYLDFRFPDVNWRQDHAGLAEWFAGVSQRPAMQATLPKEAAVM